MCLGPPMTIVERSGCEVWMHPNHEHATRAAADPEAVLQQRIEIARSAGVPAEPLAEWETVRREGPTGIACFRSTSERFVQSSSKTCTGSRHEPAASIKRGRCLAGWLGRRSSHAPLA